MYQKSAGLKYLAATYSASRLGSVLIVTLYVATCVNEGHTNKGFGIDVINGDVDKVSQRCPKTAYNDHSCNLAGSLKRN